MLIARLHTLDKEVIALSFCVIIIQSNEFLIDMNRSQGPAPWSVSHPTPSSSTRKRNAQHHCGHVRTQRKSPSPPKGLTIYRHGQLLPFASHQVLPWKLVIRRDLWRTNSSATAVSMTICVLETATAMSVAACLDTAEAFTLVFHGPYEHHTWKSSALL